jgi:hypothetical protein
MGAMNGWPSADSGLLEGDMDEVRISRIARSSDWVATEYNNQSAPAAFYSLGAETVLVNGILPPVAAIYANQSRQFTASMGSACGAPVTWSLQPAVGSVTSAGVYNAPSQIDTPQSVVLTAKLQSDLSQTASAILTLEPPIVVSVTPATATLYPGQTRQLIANVTNAINTTVRWGLAAGSLGAIDPDTGLYTAPSSIAAQTTATATATSVVDNATLGSAVITLMPSMPTYSYHRAIVIDHTKVPNTDQVNFPYRFRVPIPTWLPSEMAARSSIPKATISSSRRTWRASIAWIMRSSRTTQ